MQSAKTTIIIWYTIYNWWSSLTSTWRSKDETQEKEYEMKIKDLNVVALFPWWPVVDWTFAKMQWSCLVILHWHKLSVLNVMNVPHHHLPLSSLHYFLVVLDQHYLLVMLKVTCLLSHFLAVLQSVMVINDFNSNGFEWLLPFITIPVA